jgi:predicted HicB family RNase H-like nuclease
MKNTITYSGYMASLEFDPDDNILVGRVLGIDDLISFHGNSVAEFTEAFHEAVDDYV